MRNHRFQAWSRVDQKFIEGFAVTNDGLEILPYDRSRPPRANVVIIEWTGRFDSTGSSLYESDVVTIVREEKEIRGVIAWDPASCQFVVRLVLAPGKFETIDMNNNFVKIGNSLQDPTLVRQTPTLSAGKIEPGV